jgi:hypothetical protein
MATDDSIRLQGKVPSVVKLTFGSVYCELCHITIHAGQPVAWWHAPRRGGGLRSAVCCLDCHHAALRSKRAR